MSDLKPYCRPVYYYETDQMQIVHHSNYIRWFEEARIDFLNQMGLPYDEMEKRGFLIPVLGVSCNYKIAFRFGDIFSIVPKLDHFNGLRMHLTYEVYDEKTKELKATGESSHCFTDRNLVPLRMKRQHPDIYEKLIKYVEQKE